MMREVIFWCSGYASVFWPAYTAPLKNSWEYNSVNHHKEQHIIQNSVQGGGYKVENTQNTNLRSNILQVLKVESPIPVQRISAVIAHHFLVNTSTGSINLSRSLGAHAGQAFGLQS